MNKTKRIEYLEKQVKILEDSIWKLENPPEYKNGDIVDAVIMFGKISGKIINNPVKHEFYYTWMYEVLTESNLTFKIEQHKLFKKDKKNK
jgi:hypothetical protein